jgi:hypothetical protein
MSTKEREPLLSDEQMEGMLLTDEVCIKVQDARMLSIKTGYGLALGASLVRDFYEAARAKDAELIQQLVDALHIASRYEHYKSFPERWHGSIGEWNKAIAAAKGAGFTPSEP